MTPNYAGSPGSLCSLQNFRLEILTHCVTIFDSSPFINYETHPKRHTHTCIRVNPRWGGTINAVLKQTNMTKLGTPLTVPNSVLHASALMKLDWVCSVQTEMGNYMTNENVCWKPRTLLVVICQLHKYVSNCAYREYVFHIVTEDTGRLRNCLERVSISIIPIAWIGLCYLFVRVIVKWLDTWTPVYAH